MTASVDSIKHCLSLVFSAFANRKIPTGTFRKVLHRDGSTRHKGSRQLNESQLLPFVRLGLICYFGDRKVTGEYGTTAEWKLSGKGKLDFLVDGVAVEFAVRSRHGGKGGISPRTNETEVKKLLTCGQQRAVLALFDFSDTPLSSQQLDSFRTHPTLPQGVTPNKPYTLLYFHIDEADPAGFGCFRREIRRIQPVAT